MFNRIILLFLSACLLAGCATTGKYQPPSKRKAPGLYDVTGWNGAYVSLPAQQASAIEINLEVGHKMNLARPTADCVSPTKKWTNYTDIVSGELPPGVYIENGSEISGTPEKRGHYTAVVEQSDINCNDSYYGSFKQELRFHVTGSGIVNNGESTELIKDDKAVISYIASSSEVKFIFRTKGKPSIMVDVNHNGMIDENIDRQYGMSSHNLLCTQYMIDESTTTTCGGARSNSKLSTGAGMYVFTIPARELNNGSNEAYVRFSIYFPGNNTNYPAGQRSFSNVYKIIMP